MPAADGGKDELFTVGRPAAGGRDELEALQVRVDGGLRDLPNDAAVPGVSQEQVDGEQVSIGEEHHPTAVRTERRRDVIPTVSSSGDNAGSEAVRGSGLRQERLVCIVELGVPAGDQLIRRKRQHSLNRPIYAPPACGLPQQLSNCLIAPVTG